MSISKSSTFCPAPWNSLHINHQRQVTSCFAMIGSPIGNLNQQSLDDVINGPTLSSIKTSIAQGQWHKNCEACRIIEQTGGTSDRMKFNCDQEIIDSIDHDVEFFRLQHLMVNWSNLCNLACVYCAPNNSTAWQAVKKIPITQLKNDYDSLINYAHEHGLHLKGLSLGGGEPLLQKGMEKFLACLDPENVNVLVTTNLSVNLEDNTIYNVLKTWPNVCWMISFDNIDADKFEYVRHGAKWKDFLHNIEVIKNDQQNVFAHPAYSIYCAYDLISYYDFCQQKDLPIFWCPVNHPSELDVKKQSPALKQMAVSVIDQVLEQYADFTKGDLTRLREYQQQLENDFFTPARRLNVLAWHRLKEIELQKTHTFEKLWPDLAKALSN